MITKAVLLMGAGGALGAVARAYLSGWIGKTFPWGTLTVNVIGSFLVGVLIAFFNAAGDDVSTQLEVISLGFCGGFTTFAAFSYHTLEFLRKGRSGAALLNIFLTFVLSISAAFLGILSI